MGPREPEGVRVEGLPAYLCSRLVDQAVVGFVPFRCIFLQESGGVEDHILVECVVWSINGELVFNCLMNQTRSSALPFNGFGITDFFGGKASDAALAGEGGRGHYLPRSYSPCRSGIDMMLEVSFPRNEVVPVWFRVCVFGGVIHGAW